jgi:hypothetical protein
MVTSFVFAHLGLWVSRETRERRRAFCRECTYRRQRLAPNLEAMPTKGPVTHRDRCYGYTGGRPCDCWRNLIWRPGSVLHKTRLRFFACPLGHWDMGRCVPDAPITHI